MNDAAERRAASSDADTLVTDADRRRLFDDHLELASRLAKKYARSASDLDDVRQVARVGLHLATQRYRPDAGVFVRYATVTIIGELKKHLRATSWAVHVPRPLQEHALSIAGAIDALTIELGHAPDVTSIAQRTGLTPEQVVEGLRVRGARHSAAKELVDSPRFGDVADVAIVRDALDRLDDAMRELVHLRYDQGLTQEEIGQRLGISQPQVHRRLTRLLQQLRVLLEERP